KKPSSRQGETVSASAFINSYVTAAQDALQEQRQHSQPGSDDDINNSQRRKRSKPNNKPTNRTPKPIQINKRLLHLPEFSEDVLRPGIDRDTDLAIQLLAQNKYYKPHHFQAWKHHVTKPVRKPATLPPQDPMTRALALQRELEHTALYTSTVAPRTIERPAGYAKVLIRGRYAHVDSLGHRKEKEAEREFGKCTSCTVQGFECSGHRPICSQCFYSKSEFTASFGAKDKSMCSYPVEAREVRPVRMLTKEDEKAKQNGRRTKTGSGRGKAHQDQGAGEDEERVIRVPNDEDGRTNKSTREKEGKRWEVAAQKGRLLFDRNMAAGVDFLLRSEQEKKAHANRLQQSNSLDQGIQDAQGQGHPEGTRSSNSTSTWIEKRFFESHNAPEQDFKRRSLTRWKRKVQIGDGEDILEITEPGGSDQAQPMVLGLRPQVTEALHQDRMHENFLDRAAPNAEITNVAKSMTARALERWGTELDSNEKKGQVIEADLDGAHFRHVIGHSGFDRTLRGERSRKLMQGRLGDRWKEQQLARHSAKIEAWKAEKAKLKRSLPREEYQRIEHRFYNSKAVLREHARQLEEGGGKQRSLKRSSKVPKFRKRMEKSFRPWVPGRHDTVEPSQCDLPETTFLQSLHQYASYYYTHAQPCPDVFESMDLTAQIALGMIVQETISDFAYKLGRQGQVALDVSDDDRDSERMESDVSDNGDFLTDEDADAANEDKDKETDEDAGDRDEETEEDTSDDSQNGGRDVDDEEEDDGSMSL
ncbi:hypothetical protein BGZ81_007849, partial [Podila clonocystis]